MWVRKEKQICIQTHTLFVKQFQETRCVPTAGAHALFIKDTIAINIKWLRVATRHYGFHVSRYGARVSQLYSPYFP